MTVQTQFWDWQRNPMQPQPGRCAPICNTWMSYLLNRWGGQNVGCFNPRPIVGGSSPSSHQSGAAIDWRYQSPGMGRPAMLDQAMPFLINNSLELGVQAIHDYAGLRIWRPPGQSGRPTQVSPDCGWRPSSGGQMNKANTWLHIECLNTRWSDTRSVDEMLGDGGDDDMPSAQEIATAVWNTPCVSEVDGQTYPVGTFIHSTHKQAFDAAQQTRQEVIAPVVWDAAQLASQAQGQEGQSFPPAVFLTGIHATVFPAIQQILDRLTAIEAKLK